MPSATSSKWPCSRQVCVRAQTDRVTVLVVASPKAYIANGRVTDRLLPVIPSPGRPDKPTAARRQGVATAPRIVAVAARGVVRGPRDRLCCRWERTSASPSSPLAGPPKLSYPFGNEQVKSLFRTGSFATSRPECTLADPAGRRRIPPLCRLPAGVRPPGSEIPGASGPRRNRSKC